MCLPLTAFKYKENDRNKKQEMLDKGISLVCVPCWWDGSKDRCVNLSFFLICLDFSLATAIRVSRPDLLLEYGMIVIPEYSNI